MLSGGIPRETTVRLLRGRHHAPGAPSRRTTSASWCLSKPWRSAFARAFSSSHAVACLPEPLTCPGVSPGSSSPSPPSKAQTRCSRPSAATCTAPPSQTKPSLLQDGRVTFTYRDSRDQTRKRMTLPAHEFLRRFLQHVPTKGLHRARAYGLLHPAHRSTTLKRLQLLLAAESRPAADHKPIRRARALPTLPSRRARLAPKARARRVPRVGRSRSHRGPRTCSAADRARSPLRAGTSGRGGARCYRQSSIAPYSARDVEAKASSSAP